MFYRKHLFCKMSNSLNFLEIPDPGNRFSLENCIGFGVFGKVFRASDAKQKNKKVAIKVQKSAKETKRFIEEEYYTIKEVSTHLNIVDFFGIFKKKEDVWLIFELCEGGSVLELVQEMIRKNKRMNEEHIAFILKETVKALIFLNENKFIHRDVKASNILLTRDGEVKLGDFGLACKVSLLNKDNVCMGSPFWMSPEIAEVNQHSECCIFDNKIDVWALGITAIELGDGKAPLQEVHPLRALFQIVRNPPPTLYRQSLWTENYNDFINECLIKNPEERPHIQEVIEHPFLHQIPENNFYLSLELKSLLDDMDKINEQKPKPEIFVQGKFMKTSVEGRIEPMFTEDLAALDVISEENILKLLQLRLKAGQYHTFVGDILLILNPNERKDLYGDEMHAKYALKSRSENAPHIYSIADTAYQNALHHVLPQRLVLAGETGSGKTQNYLNLVDHLLYLGANMNVNIRRIKHGIKIIHALTHAATPFNDYSTRCIIKTDITYGNTGKTSGATFRVQCLEKWRVSSVDMFQGNFHILYYIYDGLNYENKLTKFKLNPDIYYRYLRISDSNSFGSPDQVEMNIIKFKKLKGYLDEFEMDFEDVNMIFSILSAIILIGEIRFEGNEHNYAVVQNEDCVKNVAALLKLDPKKLMWAFMNYCYIDKGSAVKKKNTTDEARDARDVLANNLYQRLVDYIVNFINQKLAIGKTIFGEKYVVKLLDYFGFECLKENHLPQLFVNCLNEQLQYHFLQRVFSWEIMDSAEEGLDYLPLNYEGNKNTLDQLLQKPEGILCLVDQASKQGLNGRFITETTRNAEKSRVFVIDANKFCVAHYTGKVSYNAKEMPNKNKDFLPPELIETLRLSESAIVRSLFANKLDKNGNLIFKRTQEKPVQKKCRFSDKLDEFSQIRRIRTACSVYRACSLDLVKELSIGGGTGSTHFVRCIRSDLNGQPQSFHLEIVKQQIRALGITETAKARQIGYPHRMSFSEFLRRYKWLAFDFEENVEINKENCRLLLIRLKMEGWAIGKSKVFLKYYNEEYLSRLYETHVKKIIKIQSILRGFLVKCNLKKKEKLEQKAYIMEVKRRMSGKNLTEEEAAYIIQQAYRKSLIRRNSIQVDLFDLDESTRKFIKPFALRWKNKSVFQVLLQYRAAKLQDFFNFSQQVHFYNLNVYNELQKIIEPIDVSNVDSSAKTFNWLGNIKPTVTKLFFHLSDIPFQDTSELRNKFRAGIALTNEETWDSPYKHREFIQLKSTKDIQNRNKIPIYNNVPEIPFNRDPQEKIANLPNNPEVKEIKSRFEPGNVSQRNAYNRKIPSNTTYYNFNAETSKRSLTKTEQDAINSNTKSANKDFEFIKPINIPARPKQDHISELRNIVRRSSSASEDDPPFNFQGMLRKTNFRRDSLKNAVEAVRRFSLKKPDPDITNTNGLTEEPINGREIAEELIPGMRIEGIEVEL